MKRLAQIFGALAVLFFVFEVISAIYYRENTGLLKLTTSDKNSQITLYQSGKETIQAGKGSARLRLAPGSYKVVATDNRSQASAQIVITKQTVLSKNLVLASPASTGQAAAYNNVNSLIKLLPYTGPANEYVISYSYQIKNNVAVPTILISASTSTNHQKAIAWIKGLGFDPTKMNIIYSSNAE